MWEGFVFHEKWMACSPETQWRNGEVNGLKLCALTKLIFLIYEFS